MMLKITRENGTHYVYYLIFDNDIDHATALGIQSFILEIAPTYYTGKEYAS